MTSPREFLDSLGFSPDPFQLRAVDALDAGRTVVVAAPTGSGKTVVAEYAIARAMDRASKTFYTTPLKALSNQKYTDLCHAYGVEHVGLLTGDNSINGAAPIVVMTTEVLRNMVYGESSTLEGLQYVILDEVHYLQDPYRGAVWEEVIIHTPPEVDLVCLSATVSNAEQFADWVATVRGDATAVIEDHRPVELHHLYMVGDRGSDTVHVVPTFRKGRPNPDAAALDERARGARGRAGRFRNRFYTPRRTEVVEELADRAMLPSIYFIFSRAGCDDAVRRCMDAGIRLTTPDERAQIREIAESRVESLSDPDLAVLGYGTWLAGLESGVAAHHAGMVPPFREAVEACFVHALVKVVFATETLSLGINMPARSVAIESLSKFSGERHEELTPGQYTQLTGRAGRRGIDEIGYAAVLWSPFVPFESVASLASTRTYELTSSFRPTYNMAANLVRRYDLEHASHLLNLSFAQFRADADVVRTEADLEHARTDLERARRPRPTVGGPSHAGRPGHTGSRRRQTSSREESRQLRRVARLSWDVGRLERRLKRREESLSRQLERVMSVLEERGYVDGWALTARGERLARIYHEADLLVAEAIDEGLLDGLDPPVLAGLVSAFTYEARGSGRAPDPSFPDMDAHGRWVALAALSDELREAEEAAGVATTRPLDPGFFGAAFSWASGRPLERVLGEAVSGGDFVRNVKQLVDLLTQVAEVAPDRTTADAAREASDAVFRGVVAASSVLAPPSAFPDDRSATGGAPGP